MGQMFATIFAQLAETRLVAVADVDRERGQAVAQATGAQAYENAEDLLSRPDVDAVAICLPDHLHTAAALKAAEAGKHLFVEKPLALSVEECDVIEEACRRAGVKLMVGHTLRFDPRFVQAYTAIREGQIGDILHVRAWRGTSLVHGRRLRGRTSVAFFLGVHDIDILHWYIGSWVRRVQAAAVRRQLAEYGVDDAIFSLLEFANGTIASVDVSWAIPPTGGQIRSNTLEKGMEITGTAGVISIAAHNIGIVVQGREAIHYPDVLYGVPVQGATFGVYAEEARHFARCVLEDRLPAVGAPEGREAVRVALAIEKALASGQPVALDQSRP